MATAEKQTQKTAGGSADLRVVPIAAVSLREGFNPRTTRDNEAFARTAWSVRETGVLQPVLVTPAAGDGNAFEVVAGEGRYLAALKAGLEELPVIVRDVDERTGGLELALAENLAREELDPVAIAGGFARLKAAGWSKRQIAEELSVTQKLVTERLLILNIPEQLRPKIASGEIPLSAVRALARVGEIHEDLPAVLDARVSDGRPSNGWAEPLDWTDVVEDPIAALTATYTGEGTALPAEVYDAGEAYPVPDLPLTDDTMVKAHEIADLQGIDLGGAKMRFAREALEQALSLKAAFPDERNYSHLIVGDDVAAQILGDQITAQLTQARKAAKDNPTPSTGNTGASSAEANGATPTDGTGTPSGARQDDEVSVVEVAEEKRRARAERQELQRAARAFNEDLGAAVLRSLVRLKIDERVLRVLIATDPLGDLGGLAMRGARYGLPGWTTEETTATGKTKVVFPTRRGCAEKAREFLQGASSVGEITGRVFALIVMARYADERAVADSNGAGYELREPTDRPWDDALVDLIDEICADRLATHLTERVIRERRDARELEVQEAKERAAARERLDGIDERLADLTDDERAAALRDAEIAYGPYGEGVWHLRQKIAAIRKTAQQAAAHTETNDTSGPGDEQPDDTHEPAAAGDEDAAKDNTPDEPAEPSAA